MLEDGAQELSPPGGARLFLTSVERLPSKLHRCPSWYSRRKIGKFIVKQNTLFLQHRSLEIAVLPHLNRFKDYRIFSSSDKSKFLIIYKYSYEESSINGR
jgi:hypothetical protein